MKVFFESKLFKLPYLSQFEAITIGRFCFVKRPSNPRDPGQLILLAHELIHQKQIDENGIIKFYAIYLKDFFINLVKYKNPKTAYYLIPFEVQAYEQQFDGLRGIAEKVAKN